MDTTRRSQLTGSNGIAATIQCAGFSNTGEYLACRECSAWRKKMNNQQTDLEKLLEKNPAHGKLLHLQWMTDKDWNQYLNERERLGKESERELADYKKREASVLKRFDEIDAEFQVLESQTSESWKRVEKINQDYSGDKISFKEAFSK